MKIAFGLWFDFIFYFVLNFLLFISKLFFLNKLLTVKKNFEILCILFRRHALFTRFDIDKNAYSSHDSEVFHWFWIWLQPICIISGWFLFSVSNKVLYKFIVFLFVCCFFFGIDRMLFVRLFEKTFFWHRRWWRASDYDNV